MESDNQSLDRHVFVERIEAWLALAFGIDVATPGVGRAKAQLRAVIDFAAE
jgi:hypothetical protein